MSPFWENMLIYAITALFMLAVLYLYLNLTRKKSAQVYQKINEAKQSGLFEPVSLHPVIDLTKCMGSAACISACPEQDILGWYKGKAQTINASRCVGHGACFHACPVDAISLVIGTEKRGVELPHVNAHYETNVKGIFIAGELGGMGLIKNAVEQAKSAMQNIKKQLPENHGAPYDVIIIGAGPAGITATLSAHQKKMRYLTIEQESLGGTVYTFPRPKLVMTQPMDLPLYGKVHLRETSKDELITLWEDILQKNNISINEKEKVVAIKKQGTTFIVETNKQNYNCARVLLTIGRRGTPRKLGVKGELSPKVAYRLLEPERIQHKHILIVGGGDSAIESALMLCNNAGNMVSLSYRKAQFNRLKPKNLERILNAINSGKVHMLFGTTVTEIKEHQVLLQHNDSTILELKNDLVYIFAGGELPNQFLKNSGIHITKKYGEALLKH